MNEKKSLFPTRNHRTATCILAVVLIALALALALNGVLSALPFTLTQFDLAKVNDYSLSAKSKDWLGTLDTDVTLYLICAGGEAAVDRDLYGFLEEYTSASDHIKLEVIDPRQHEGLIVSFGGVWPAENSVIVSSEMRYRIINNAALYCYYNQTMGTTFSLEEYNELTDAFLEMDASGSTALSFAESTLAQFDGESRITNAINFVSLERTAKLYQLSGNGAASIGSALENLLMQSGFEFYNLLSLAEIPTDCNMLIINAPSVDLSDLEKAGLESYLSRGGKLFLTTFFQKTTLPKFAEVLDTYGMSFDSNLYDYVCEENPNYYLSGQNQSHALFYAHIQSNHPASGSFEDNFVVWQAHAIELTSREGVVQTSWLHTSEAGYLKKYDPENKVYLDGSERKEITVGAIAQKGESAIVWLSSPSMLDSTYSNLADNNGNFMLILSAINHFTGTGNNGITIAPTSINQPVLTVNATQFTVTAVLLVVVLPLTAAISGIVIWGARKRR